MRLQFEKREFISFRLFSSFQSPWPRDRVASRAPCGLWHCHLRVETRLRPRLETSAGLLETRELSPSHASAAPQWVGPEFLSLCLVLKLPWDVDWVRRRRASEDWALFRFLFSPKGLWYGNVSALVLLRRVGQVFLSYPRLVKTRLFLGGVGVTGKTPLYKFAF